MKGWRTGGYCIMNGFKRKTSVSLFKTRHADDATQLVAVRPNRHAHISICLVFSLCQWPTAYSLIDIPATKSWPTQGSNFIHVWLHRVYCNRLKLCSILLSATVNLPFLWLQSFIFLKFARIFQTKHAGALSVCEKMVKIIRESLRIIAVAEEP